MVNNFTYILTALFIGIMVYAIYKKPGILKKDESKPLSVSNFSLKKTFIGDWKQFGTWILLMFLVWSYAHDTKACRDMIENLDQICSDRAMQLMEFQDPSNLDVDLTQLNLRGDDGDTRQAGVIDQQGGPDLIP